MIRNVLTLFKTFVEIILLQKGPDDIPHSPVLFVLVVALWFLVGVFAMMVIEFYESNSLLIDLILAFVGLGIYAIVVSAFGKTDRLMRCFTAILGCSIVFTIERRWLLGFMAAFAVLFVQLNLLAVLKPMLGPVA